MVANLNSGRSKNETEMKNEANRARQRQGVKREIVVQDGGHQLTSSLGQDDY